MIAIRVSWISLALTLAALATALNTNAYDKAGLGLRSNDFRIARESAFSQGGRGDPQDDVGGNTIDMLEFVDMLELENADRILRGAKQSNAQLCVQNELTDLDLAMRGDDISLPLPRAMRHAGIEASHWRELFKAWGGKRVLLAGDSLMGQLFRVAWCAAGLLGGAVDLSNVARVDWAPGKDEAVYTNYSGGPFTGLMQTVDTQALVWRASITVDNHTATIDWFSHYSLTQHCQACPETTGRDAAACGEFCSTEHALRTQVETLAGWAEDYDHIHINLGHAVMLGDVNYTEQQARSLIAALQAKRLQDRVILVEHTPQHFDGQQGDGNYHGQMGCKCGLPHLEQQTVSINNERLGRVAQDTGIRLAKIWGLFASACDRHPGGKDCTHYHLSPALWAPVAKLLR